MTKKRSETLLEQENAALRAQLKRARTALAKLRTLSIEGGFPKGVKLAYPSTEEDAAAPFLSEAYLYPVFGKDNARTVLAFFNQLQHTLLVERPDVYLAEEKALDLWKTSTYAEFRDAKEDDMRTFFGRLRQYREARRETRSAESSVALRLFNGDV